MKCGTTSSYRAGCRCDDCKKWRADYYAQTADFDKKMREYDGMDVLVDAAPTARRLQALAVAGWGATEIADRIGLHSRNLTKVRSLDHPTVKTSTARKVAKFYRENVHVRADTTRGGRIARTRALNNGWRSFAQWACIERGIVDGK